MSEELNTLVPEGSTPGNALVEDADINEAHNRRRRQVTENTQRMMQLIDEIERQNPLVDKDALRELAARNRDASLAWDDDLAALRQCIAYARELRLHLDSAAYELNQVFKAVETVDMGAEIIQRLDEQLAHAHELEYELKLLAKIENAHNGLNFVVTAGIMAALQGEPVTGSAAPQVADWLRYLADQVDQAQEAKTA